jgi:hypothetical protein
MIGRKLVYLAGAMKGLTYEEANKWRKEFALRSPVWLETHSPMRGKELHILQEQSGGVIGNSYPHKPLSTWEGINTRDYNDVKTSGAVVANLLDMNTKSVGTIMEIAWAGCMQIPRILIVPENIKEDNDNPYNHPMLLYGAILVHTVEDAVDVAVSLLSNDKENKEYFDGKARND